MISINEVIETNAMISRMNLDVRTITMGISLLDCVGGTLKETCDNIYNKITTKAKDLVYTGEEISKKYGYSQSQVKTALFRMREGLKQHLEKEGYAV